MLLVMLQVMLLVKKIKVLTSYGCAALFVLSSFLQNFENFENFEKIFIVFHCSGNSPSDFDYKHLIVGCSPLCAASPDCDAGTLESHSSLGIAVGESHGIDAFQTVTRNRTLWICFTSLNQPFPPICFHFPVLLAFLSTFYHFVPLLFQWQVKRIFICTRFHSHFLRSDNQCHGYLFF